MISSVSLGTGENGIYANGRGAAVGHWRSSCLCRMNSANTTNTGFPSHHSLKRLTRHDEEPPRRPGFSVRTKRIVVVGLIIGVIIPIVFGPRLMSFGRELVVAVVQQPAQKKFWDHDMRRRRSGTELRHRSGARTILSCVGSAPYGVPIRTICRAALKITRSAFGWQNRLRNCRWPNGKSSISRAAWYQCCMPIAAGYTCGWANREALDDVNKAVELHPSAENLNTRAYAARS